MASQAIEQVEWRPGMAERRRLPRDQAAGTRPVDLGYLGRFTLSNRELEREVLYLFAGQLPVYVASLQSADNGKDWLMAAHTIKGSARAVGAWRLARAAQAAERLGYCDDLDRRQHAIDLIAEAGDEAIEFIVQIFPET